MRRRAPLLLGVALSLALVAGACSDEDADRLPTEVPTDEVPSDVESVAGAAAEVFCGHIDELQAQLDELQGNPDVDTSEVSASLTDLAGEIESDADALRTDGEEQLAQAADGMALAVRSLAQLVGTAGDDPNVQAAIAAVAASLSQVPEGACGAA